MPKFPKNTGFKLPGIGSREIDTPGNFRKSQKVEDVGYCDNTESHMLPPGSSPLLAKEEPKDWLVPDYYHTTYTASYRPRAKEKPEETKDDNTDDTVDTNTSTHTDREIKSEVNQTPGEERRGVTKFKKGTNINEAKKFINDTKAQLRLECPTCSEDEITQMYRKKMNIGDVTYTPGETTITQTYWVNDKQVSKEAYDAAGPGDKKEVKQ